jgi:hypothetical protein
MFNGVKLATHLHTLPRSRMVELYLLNSDVRNKLQGKNISPIIFVSIINESQVQ